MAEEENTPEDSKSKKSRPIGAILLGLVLIGILVVLFLPSGFNPGFKAKAANSDAKYSLNELLLSCKSYWAKNGSDKECNVDLASQSKYGFKLRNGVNIKAHGNETTFTATAQHLDSTTSFTMDANGEIR